ncbi:MAG: D-2-hydroxyacid dehydrogenase [Pseudomonadota bacterium]
MPATLVRIIFMLLLFASSAVTGTEPSKEARAIIAELGLRESPAPSRQMDGWDPKRIVVWMPFGIRDGLDDYRTALIQAAGKADLVFSEVSPLAVDAAVLDGADAVIGHCTQPLLAAADKRLRWVHNYTVGIDLCKGFSPEQASLVTFSNNQRLSAPAIAEHSIAMLLALTRNLPGYYRAQLDGRWQRSLRSGVTFGELKGKTLLVVGLGGIGTEIARRASGLGMRVIATRNSSWEGPDFVDYVGLSDELLELAQQADVVANALPLTAATTALFDKAFFDSVKAGAIFLSVGRGKSTVTADLIEALESGQLFGAGLDVTDPEPLPSSSPLWSMDNVIITPHTSSEGAESNHRSRVIAIENLRRYVAGDPLLNVVDVRRGY